MKSVGQGKQERFSREKRERERWYIEINHARDGGIYYYVGRATHRCGCDNDSILLVCCAIGLNIVY